jgi:hypothetical protein
MDAWGHVVAHHITCNAATCGYTYLYLFLPIGFPHWHVHVRALRSSSSAGSHSHPPFLSYPPSTSPDLLEHGPWLPRTPSIELSRSGHPFTTVLSFVTRLSLSLVITYVAWLLPTKGVFLSLSLGAHHYREIMLRLFPSWILWLFHRGHRRSSWGSRSITLLNLSIEIYVLSCLSLEDYVASSGVN